MTFAQQQEALAFIHAAQGFQFDRVAQYFYESELPRNAVASRTIVRHAKTGTKFCLKAFSKDELELNLALLANELESLQRLRKFPNVVVGLVDHFEDEDFIYIVTEHCEKGSLRQYYTE